MGCGCADRGKMIASAGKQALRGNIGQAVRRLQAVGASAAKDVRQVVTRPANPKRAHELARLKLQRRF